MLPGSFLNWSLLKADQPTRAMNAKYGGGIRAASVNSLLNQTNVAALDIVCELGIPKMHCEFQRSTANS